MLTNFNRAQPPKTVQTDGLQQPERFPVDYGNEKSH